jgi:hypothetical protein
MKSVEGNAGGAPAPCIALLLLLCSFLFLRCAKDGAGPLAEPLPFSMAKSNPMQVYVHYMPWFKSKEYAGAWGLHWTMRNSVKTHAWFDSPEDVIATFDMDAINFS